MERYGGFFSRNMSARRGGTVRNALKRITTFLVFWLFFVNNMPDVVELSGTGVPPGLLNEVVERRSGAYRGGGTAFRRVPAEIKH